MNCVTVDPDRAADFERAFAERERLLNQAAGFRGFQLLRRDRGAEYVVFITWESEEHFRAWVRSDLFRRSHRRDGERGFGGHSELRMYEVLDVEDPVAAV